MGHSVFNDFLYAFIAIFPTINPFAMSSIFYSLTKRATIAQRNKLAFLISIYGAILLIGALIIGPFLLRFFGLHASDIRVAGGLVIFAIAWKMILQSDDSDATVEEHKETMRSDIMDQAFYPLTMPITAGAGGLAIVVALAAQADKSLTWQHIFDRYIAIAIAIIAVFILVFICYRYSSAIFKVLGKTGSKAVSSISAFILLAISVSVMWSGIKIYISTMH